MQTKNMCNDIYSEIKNNAYYLILFECPFCYTKKCYKYRSQILVDMQKDEKEEFALVAHNGEIHKIIKKEKINLKGMQSKYKIENKHRCILQKDEKEEFMLVAHNGEIHKIITKEKINLKVIQSKYKIENKSNKHRLNAVSDSNFEHSSYFENYCFLNVEIYIFFFFLILHNISWLKFSKEISKKLSVQNLMMNLCICVCVCDLIVIIQILRWL